MEIVKVDNLGTQPEFQEYDTRDVNLIEQKIISPKFTLYSQDYVEYFVYDENKTLLVSNYYAYNYTPIDLDSTNNSTNTLKLNPESDIKAFGIDRGSVDITYNFYSKLLSSSYQDQFWISEISTDRTELRAQRNDISNNELYVAFANYKTTVNGLAYYPDFLLNFGDNKTLIGVNMLFATGSQQASVLIKLYEPLPSNVQLKDTFWLVNKLAEPQTYNITVEVPVITPTSSFSLRGPNYDIDINRQIGQTTDLLNYNSLFGLATGSLTTSSSYSRLRSLLQEKSIDINVDYSNFKNFINYSSATERINNFVYKLELIELEQKNYITSSLVTTGSGIVSRSLVNNLDTINNIINKFDEYEYYLYYSNDDTAWPKYDVNTPVKLKVPYSVTSSQAINWLGSSTLPSSGSGYLSILYSASIYDIENPNHLLNTLPQYIKDDYENSPAFLFTSMLGQHFDNLYVYYKDVTSRYQADNSNDRGISKDLVADTLRSFGINLYTNTNISNDFYYSLLGIGPNGDLRPEYFPTGSEISQSIVSYPTSSLGGTSIQDINTEIYKRLYHNLPYLLKTKGTERGLRALIACYGIPETLLRINEYGGSNDFTKVGSQIRNSSYSALFGTVSGSTTITSTTASVITPWSAVSFDYLTSGSIKVPDTIQFRFNSYWGHPTTDYNGTTWGSNFYSHSVALFHLNTGSYMQFGVRLDYISTTQAQYSPLANIGITGSAVSGSVYENYGYLSLYLSGGSGYKSSSQIYLPFYDPTLSWNLYVYRETSSLASSTGSANRYWVYAETDLYSAEGNTTQGFVGSASIDISAAEHTYNRSWNLLDSASLLTPTTSVNLNGVFRGYLGGNNTNGTLGLEGYSGLYQEFRYWRGSPDEYAKNVQTYSPGAYSDSSATASLFNCIFRIPLGRDVSTASAYFATQFSESVLTTYPDGNYAVIGDNLAGYDLTSLHPAITGTFNIPGYGNVNRVPSFYTFPGSGTLGFVNGAVYGNSAFATNYHTYNQYEIISTPRSGRYQKVNNKVFIPDTIETTGSTLSPYVSSQKLDQSQTRNSLDLEIAFSPSDQIDDDISFQFGNVDLDEYVGNPSDLYSSSYSDLRNLKDFYFSKYITSYNVYDLVRAIKFYDNSLFKMIKDFVPARANLTTGVLVKSHLLERNKVKSYAPNVSISLYNQRSKVIATGSVDTAFISGSNGIGVSLNTTFIDTIEGLTGSVNLIRNDGAESFTGRYGGSTIKISSSFTQLVDNKISDTTTVQDYVLIYLNYLQHNISGSVTSVKIADLDYSTKQYIPVNFGLIDSLYYTMSLNPNNSVLSTGFWPYATLNDANYNSFVFTSLRYAGSKNSSSLYNTYSILDSTIPSVNRAYGDVSAVDSYVNKVGLFTQIVTSSVFFQRNNASLIYLVDESGSFTELNRDNKNWEELQNTFKLGELATVKLFDNQKYSNQKLTDGPKTIFNSGYSYYPILYYSQSIDNKLYFLKTAETPSNNSFSANNSRNPNGFISGSSSNKYPFRTSGSLQVVYSLFDNITENQNNNFTAGTSTSYPKYTVSSVGVYRFTSSLDLSTEVQSTGISGSYTYSVLKNGSSITSQTKFIPTSSQYLSVTNFRAYIDSNRSYDSLAYYATPTTTTTPIEIRGQSGDLIDTIPVGQYLYIVTGSGNICKGPVSGEYVIANDIQYLYGYGASSTAPNPTLGGVTITGSVYGTVNLTPCGAATSRTFNYINSAIVWSNSDGGGNWISTVNTNLTSTQNFSIATDYLTLTTGDVIEFKLQLDSLNTTNFTSSLSTAGTLGFTQGTQVVGLYPFATSSAAPFVSGTDGNNQLILNNELSGFYGYQFLPEFTTGSIQSSSLFNSYGAVDYPFSLDVGDTVIVKKGTLYQESEVRAVEISGSNSVVKITINPELPSSFLPINLLTEVIFLSKKKDESNVIFNFAKKPGQTSYGLVIPNNVSPRLMKNIDSITREIQSKLIETNQPLQ